MQLYVSLNTTFLKVEVVEVRQSAPSSTKKLKLAVKFCKLGKAHTCVGIVPQRRLLATLSCSKFIRFPNEEGRVPMRMLWLKSKTVSCVSCPNWGGIQASNEFPNKTSSLRVKLSPLKLVGISPFKVL